MYVFMLSIYVLCIYCISSIKLNMSIIYKRSKLRIKMTTLGHVTITTK